MWKAIRGNGYAYGYSMRPQINEGLLQFSLSTAANVTEAYKVAKKMVNEYVEKGEFEQTLYESAKSSLVFEVVQREQNIGDVVAQSMLSYFKHVDQTYNRY